MLQTMRQNTKIILWITVIFFVLLIFLVWGADLQLGGGNAQPNNLGSVNGNPISIADFQTVYQQNRQAASVQGRDLQPTEIIAIEEQSWSELVDNVLLQEEAARLNLEAHDSEVRTTMLSRPPALFQRAFVDSLGRFNYQAYRQYILNPATPEQELVAMENYIRANLPIQKLQQLIFAGAVVPEADVRQAFLDQNQEAEVSYVLVPTPAVNDQPDDAAVKAHFDANPDRYELPRRADLMYVTLRRVATAQDSTDIRKELAGFAQEAREARQGGAESDALRYSDFETLAMTFSDGPNADTGGLSAGYLSPEEMTPPMAAAVAGLAPGDISEPFLDGGMYHIVQVVDEKTQEDVRTVQIRDLALRIAPSDSTLEANRERMEEIRQAARADGLAKAAAEAGMTAQQVSDVTQNGFAPGLGLVPGIGNWAVTHEAGTLSRVYYSNEGWHLVEILDVKEPGLPEFEAVKAQVRSELMAERRLQAAEPRAKRLLGQVKLGKTLEEAAGEEELEVQSTPAFTRASGMPGFMQEPAVTATAFVVPVGQVSEPVETDRGWVILRVDARPEVDESLYEAQAQQIRNSLLQLQRVTLYNAYLERLRQDADIEDFRS